VTREELLISLAAQVLVLHNGRAALVAIDGMSCVGKSTLAAELIAVVEGAGRPVLHVSADNFHHPRAVRHRRHRMSAEGYLDDSYDLESLQELVLEPVVEGKGEIRTASFDLAADEPVEVDPVQVQPDAVVVVEGEFLLSPRLTGSWDLAVLLVAEPSAVLERALVRDADLGTPEQVREVYLRRYLAAWSLHEERHDPWSRADVVVDLTDPMEPRLLSGS
jgi:uridine kinase